MSQQNSDSGSEEQLPSSASGVRRDFHMRAADMGDQPSEGVWVQQQGGSTTVLQQEQRDPGGASGRVVNPAYWTCNRVLTAWSGRRNCQHLDLRPLPYMCSSLPTCTLLNMALELLENVPEAQTCLRSLLSGSLAGQTPAVSEVGHWLLASPTEPTEGITALQLYGPGCSALFPEAGSVQPPGREPASSARQSCSLWGASPESRDDSCFAPPPPGSAQGSGLAPQVDMSFFGSTNRGSSEPAPDTDRSRSPNTRGVRRQLLPSLAEAATPQPSQTAETVRQRIEDFVERLTPAQQLAWRSLLQFDRRQPPGEGAVSAAQSQEVDLEDEPSPARQPPTPTCSPGSSFYNDEALSAAGPLTPGARSHSPVRDLREDSFSRSSSFGS